MPQFSPSVSPPENLKSHISSAISEIIRLLENLWLSGNDRNPLDYSLYKLEQIVYLCVSSQNIWRDFITDEFVILLLTAYNTLGFQDKETLFPSRCQPVYTGLASRPALNIPRETLKLYLNYGFSLKKIAEIFEVSRKTISRRITNYSLKEEVSRYADLTDDALDEFVASILHNFPNCGIRRMKGFLLGQGIRVQWNRVRESLWRTDPTRFCCELLS